jgi:hypothetical protein
MARSRQDRIWERWRVDHPKARTLPMILPIVMYHGVTPWSEPRSFDALLDVPAHVRPAVEPYLVRFTYLLNDLSEIPDDELREGARRTALAKLAAMCLKHARTGADFVQLLGRWIHVVREVATAPNGLQALAQVMRYILEVSEQVTPEALQALLEREIGPEAKDTIVTAGQTHPARHRTRPPARRRTRPPARRRTRPPAWRRTRPPAGRPGAAGPLAAAAVRLAGRSAGRTTHRRGLRRAGRNLVDPRALRRLAPRAVRRLSLDVLTRRASPVARSLRCVLVWYAWYQTPLCLDSRKQVGLASS